MASGHRKRKAALVRQYVLDTAIGNPLSNVPESDRGDLEKQNNLVNLAIYSKGGYAPAFSDGVTGLFSNPVSNVDGLWSLAGLTGETENSGTFSTSSMSGAIGLFNTTKHYLFPKQNVVGGLDLSASSVAGPFMLYSFDSQYANYVPKYHDYDSESGASTQMVYFNKNVTGSGSPTHVAVYIAGDIPPNSTITCGSPGDPLTPLNARVSTNNFATIITEGASASATDLSSANYRKAFLIATGSINSSNGLSIGFTTLGNTSTTLYKGFFIAISSGSYP